MVRCDNQAKLAGDRSIGNGEIEAVIKVVPDGRSKIPKDFFLFFKGQGIVVEVNESICNSCNRSAGEGLGLDEARLLTVSKMGFNGEFSACEMELTYLLQNPRKNVLVT